MSKRPAQLADASDQKRARLSNEPEAPSADDVAADFKDSLSDLSINDRYQISTLTIIAKENTEHALAISDVLLTHIRTVAPPRKLPSLYVLDSIVKNVGTPYTIFLSRNLFKTFMDAYTLVDSGVRKQMESMLKTWKEPVPGSMDPKPVFPIDVTRTIENALIRARTVFVEQQKVSGLGPLVGQRPHTMSPHLPHPPPAPTYQYQQPEFQYGLQGYQNPPTPSYQPPVVRSPPPFAYQTPSQQYQSPYAPPPSHNNSYSLIALLQASGQFQPPPQQPPQQESFQFPGLEALYQTQGRINTPPVPLPIPQIPSVPPPLPFILPQSQPGKPPVFPTTQDDDLDFSPASLKRPRPQLLAQLYPTIPSASRCKLCGRRFDMDTEDGRARKTRHLDAHFRTNMRLTAIAEGKGPPGGVTRSWYLDEMEWIQYREIDDADQPLPLDGDAGERVEGAAVRKGEKYIIAPADAAAGKRSCPICQEDFAAVWHDGEQEWVWMDAVKIPPEGDLKDPATVVYHASCLEDMARDAPRR